MNIQPDDIEALIFDFHEGNLSASEKSELLNFIHLHPEYEKDFALWAQSYVPTNTMVEDYGLTKNLLHETNKPWYNRPLTYVHVPLLLAFFLSLTVFVYYTIQKPSEHIYKKPLETINSVPLVSSVPLAVVSKKIKIQAPVLKKSLTSISIPDTEIPMNYLTVKETVESKNTITDSIIVKDTININNDIIKNSEVRSSETIKSKQNSKRKSKFSIAPSSSFIPINPNF